MIGSAVGPWTVREWVPAVILCLGMCLAGCLQDPQVQLRPQPVVLETSPADAATLVATTTAITARFSTALDERTVDETSFLLLDGTTEIPGTVTSSAATATFLPVTKLSPLRSYTAILKADIKGTDGLRLPADHVWTFRTRDGAWSAAEQIESSAYETVDLVGSFQADTFPAIALDADGSAIALWGQATPSSSPLRLMHANRFTGVSGWGSPSELTMVGGIAYGPQVAMDLLGNALAVWWRTDATSWSARFSPTTGWEPPFGLGANSRPHIAMDANGNAISVWVRGGGISAYRYLSGAGWGTETVLDTAAAAAENPRVAMTSNGNALATWQQSDGVAVSIWTNRFTNLAWGTAALIESDAGAARDSRVALDPNGNGVAVWSQTDGMRESIRASRFLTATGWGAVELIDVNAGDARTPQVSVDQSGKVFAVWTQYLGTRDRILMNAYTEEDGWGIARPLDADLGNAFDPELAMSPDGRAAVVWRQSNTLQSDIWGCAYSPATGWGAPVLLSSGGDASKPKVAIDLQGSATSVWLESDGVRTNVWSSRFVFD